jgi:hypothetical protein
MMAMDAKTFSVVAGVIFAVVALFHVVRIFLKTNGSDNIRPNELARRICHLAMEGERDPARLHDRALGGLIPATIWREVS